MNGHDRGAAPALRSVPLVVWQLSDGKRGHERQAEGLIQALAARITLSHHRIALAGSRAARAWHALGRRFPAGAALPPPDLLIGAGHACHFALIAARRACGGRSVCLMRPQLPWHWFDAVIVPRHDAPPVRANVIVSEGTLNPMRPAPARDPAAGLILLGGPSAHHGWDTRAVLAQIEALLARDPARHWVVTDSRRSPPALTQALRTLAHPRLRYVPFAVCAADWLPTQLARAAEAWVSVDSVAMLFEALTAGARVGLIEVPARRADRISRIAPDLAARGWVMRPGETRPRAAPAMLDEAGRCAEALLARWPALARAPGAS